MSTLFWIGIALHIFLCLFLMLLVLIQNDKMGGLAGLGGMTSQSAFSTAGAATFIQKLTRGVAIVFFAVVILLGVVASKQGQTTETSVLKQSAQENSATNTVVPQLPATVPMVPAEKSQENPLTVPAQ
jgi:preprotein translocase subunit SecG